MENLLMNKFDKELTNAKNALMELPLVKEYIALKEALRTSEELKDVRLELVRLQKEMTLNVNNPAKHASIKQNYDELKNKYDNHPLVLNYKETEEEVYNLLKEIQNILIS